MLEKNNARLLSFNNWVITFAKSDSYENLA